MQRLYDSTTNLNSFPCQLLACSYVLYKSTSRSQGAQSLLTARHLNVILVLSTERKACSFALASLDQSGIWGRYNAQVDLLEVSRKAEESRHEEETP